MKEEVVRKMDLVEDEVSEDSDMEESGYHYSFGALDILRETVRILRSNAVLFMSIAAVLLSPVSALLLCNVLVNQGMVNRVAVTMLLTVKSSGLPLSSLVRQACYRFSEMIVSSVVYFPLYCTLLLISKAAVVYSVDCSYSRKEAGFGNVAVIAGKLWKRIVFTYLWSTAVISGCFTLFCVLLIALCSLFMLLGLKPDLNLYIAMAVGLMFSVVFANAIVVCSVAVVISVLEDVSGLLALLRASSLVRGQIQVGLLLYLVCTIGMAFIEGLFQHRVKTLSYGDGSSRLWEGPLLVIMHSFSLLIDFMTSTVFYFNCKKNFPSQESDGECLSMLETITLTEDAG